jgi:SAM-dependent methyltransferase
VLPGVVARVRSACAMQPQVVDVGCGQGVALKHFKALDCAAWGITTNRVDLAACRAAGFEAWDYDMHEIHLVNDGCDLIWARHVLEHSPAPLFALHEFKRVLRPGGWLYIEVPMPGTSCHHEENRNHYSVLTDSMWQSLIGKAGFEIVEAKMFALSTPAGPDEYRSYLCRK